MRQRNSSRRAARSRGCTDRGSPGGRAFCYFDGEDAVIVWTDERRGQPTHKDILGIAREGGSDHVRLTSWWRPWHHIIGKANINTR